MIEDTVALAGLTEPVVNAFDSNLESILSVRSPIVILEGLVIAGDFSAAFTQGDAASLLVAYLRLIRSIRHQLKQPLIALRRDDLLVLAAHVDESAADVLERLTSLMGATVAQRRAMASMFAAGALVIALVCGSVVGVVAPATASSASIQTGAASITAPPSSVSTGLTADELVVIEALTPDPVPELVTLAAAVRLDVPDGPAQIESEAPVAAPAVAAPVAAAPPPPVVNASNCRTDLANPLMSIVIPQISYSCPVYAGGQAMIDAGAATLIAVPGLESVLADHPGEAGTLWIAGHRSSHGAAFAAVPSLADGAIITVADGQTTASYRIVGRAYVKVVNDKVVDASGHPSNAATVDSVFRADHGGGSAPRLLLQTCDGTNFRWMIYADLVT